MGFGQIFDSIYRTNKWGGLESQSGPGSGSVARDNIAPAILELVEQYGFTSILDAGCGDGFWMPDLPGYIGIDVSEAALTLHRERHPDRDLRLDTGEPYPVTELTISRCVMQHLSFADGLAYLDKIRSKWLLATSNRSGMNENITTGGGYWVNLEQNPFYLGPPERFIKDGHSDDGDHDNILGLWDISKRTGVT